MTRTSRCSQLAVAAFAVALITAAALPASADIIVDTNIIALGQGFGANPRLLTVQTPSGTESGCVGFTGLAGPGQCDGHDATFLPNGVISTGGQETSGGQDIKNNSALLSASNITNATQIVLVYNPSQQGSDPGTTITDVTLKFYSSTGTEVISVDNGPALVFADTGVNLGNGGVGFALVLTANEAAAVNAACGANLAGCTTIALESTITNGNDGPDSFTLFSRAAATVPEPTPLALLGSTLIGLAFVGWRRSKNVA